MFHALYAFDFGIINFAFFFISCAYLQNVASVDIKTHFASFRPISNFSRVLLEAHLIVVGDYRVTDFRIIGQLGNKVIKSNIDIISVNYK